ncbi:MAG: Fe-Mn family superoxide dismutase [Bythopirellula sp.]|nr:Fe-Mn family superoxide dismutase [Bythopirellula sp.]
MNLPEDFSRRNFLQVSAVTGAALLTTLPHATLAQAPAAPPTGPYKLPPLPYAFDALVPTIDALTMEIHHDKHHAAYVNNLNIAVQGTDLGEQTVEDLITNLNDVPEAIRTAVQNQGGGHANHSLFWTIMAPNAGGEPRGDLVMAIQRDLGGFAAFKTALTEAATKRFGSGWAWLCVDENKKLHVESTANQDSPLMHGHTPILGLDVWEHAYYLHYQNRRPEYIEAFFNVINWPAVGERYGKAVG